MVVSGPVEVIAGLGELGAGWYSGARVSVGRTEAPPTGAIGQYRGQQYEQRSQGFGCIP